jgi:cell division protein FtsA
MIEVAPATGGIESTDGRKVTRAELVGVICERLGRLMKDVAAALNDMGFQGPVARQVVLTGGGAELKGIADYAQTALGRAVRIGRPKGLAALPDAHSGPAFATLAGIALHVASNPLDLRTMPSSIQTVHRSGQSAWLQRLIAAFRANY